MKRLLLPVAGSRRLALVAFAVLTMVGNAAAELTQWDHLLSDSKWYVRAENLLAYMTPGDNLADPQALADQTLWEIGSSSNGIFSGNSATTFKFPIVPPISSTATMNGVITPGGQVRITFTQEGAPTTIGIGQAREIEGQTYLEMQMITGDAASGFVTHWAYMVSYDGDPSSLPLLEIDDTFRAEEWDWMLGTDWGFENAGLFGEGETGTFHIEGTRNGYFWGSGSGPLGSAGEEFTLIGSATPEGNLLFSFLTGGAEQTLTSLTGQIIGDAGNGRMLGLRPYTDSSEMEVIGYAYVIPEPSSLLLFSLAAAGGLAVGRRRRLRG